MSQNIKPLPWLRLYTEIIDDEKLGLLAFEDRWHFTALLCIKGKGILDSGDDFEMMQRKVALKLGLTCSELEKVITRLSRMGLIDAKTYQPIAWDERQMKSDVDPTNSDRQRRFKERKKAEKLGNASVTVLDTDTDTDTDTEKETHTASAGGREAVASVCVDFSETNQPPEAPLSHGSEARDAPLVAQLQQAGITDAQVGNPVVLRLLDGGVPALAFVSAVETAKRKGRTDLPYIIGIVRRQSSEATAVAAAPSVALTQWDNSRTSIESEGQRLGIGGWCNNPTVELFSNYTQRVRVARAQQFAPQKASA